MPSGVRYISVALGVVPSVIRRLDTSMPPRSRIAPGCTSPTSPAADAPTVTGPPAREVALTLLAQIRAGDVDRALLGDEYNAFLTPTRLAVMSKALVDAGEVSDVQPGAIRERGGMEVSTLALKVGSTAASTLMYRTPDGKVQEFLFSRR